MPEPSPRYVPAHFAHEALFGGQGRVGVWDLMGPMPGGLGVEPFTAVLACELAPGGAVGAHTQQRDPEIVIVTAGLAQITVDGMPVTLGPGGLAPVPIGSVLAIANLDATQALHYMIIKARAGGPEV